MVTESGTGSGSHITVAKNVQFSKDIETHDDVLEHAYNLDLVASNGETLHELVLDDGIDTAAPSIATLDEDSPWARKNILSLDGGGVRGYSSLLILKRIMEEVGRIERENNPDARSSSYSPLVSPLPQLAAETTDYRPCHYFDYIAGTSTGGLSAIMLGRLRMSVESTMDEYKQLSAKVFEKPSSRLRRSLANYSSASRRETLTNIFHALRPAQPSPEERNEKFSSDSFRCRTMVCSMKRSQKKEFQMPFLFRSYDHRKTSHTPLERNPGDTHAFNIADVARASKSRVLCSCYNNLAQHQVIRPASRGLTLQNLIANSQQASGAPSYRRSTKLFEARYYDAAVDLNNPSWEVINEVNLLGQPQDTIDLLLSLGGGNGKGNQQSLKFGVDVLQKDLMDISDVIHAQIEEESHEQGFEYYRLDVKGGLQDVRLNEWKPKSTGEITLRRIEFATNKYLQDPDVQADIERCARALVRNRALRAQTQRWETFATGTRYRCTVPGCDQRDLRFQNRNELMDHLQSYHDMPPPDEEHYKEIQKLLDAGRTNSG